MSFEEDTTVSHEMRIRRCPTCRGRVIFFKTPAGKNMPVDADTVEPEDEELDLSRHKSHFSVCRRKR